MKIAGLLLNNLPVIETLAQLIPGGRVSHLAYDGDTLRANILIPDTLRKEDDSDYGGGISVLNNETGRYPYVQRPFVFRSICFNGNVWDRADGIEVRKYHKGDINWNDFREAIVLNLQRQIPLVHENIAKVLGLKNIPLSEMEIQQAIVTVGERERMTNKLCQAWHEGFKTEAANTKPGSKSVLLSAFGVVQGLTRAAQVGNLEGQEMMETLSAKLVDGNWDRLMTAARMTDADKVQKVLALP